MAEKMCNTINHNIEPQTERKLLNNYSKQIGTLLNTLRSSDRNDSTNVSIARYLDSITNNETISTRLDPAKHEKPRAPTSLREATNIDESVISTIPNSKRAPLNLICSSSPVDDTLSDVDLENFGPTKGNGNPLSIISSDKVETVSLSNFHNVSDALLYFKNRLESYLKTNSVESTDDGTFINGNGLKENISELKRELERYVDQINERKENELRKFSENMMKQSKILQMQNAFSRQEKLKTNFYETLKSSHFKYAIADNDSLPNSFRYFREQNHSQGCLGDSSYYSDYSSIECYTMLINEERPERLLNDAAPHPRYYGRERISLVFRDPTNVIKQWQALQPSKRDRSMRSLWSKRHSLWPRQSESIWGFTLDSHKNEMLELKLYEEQRMRLILRLFFGFLSVVMFVFIVFLVDSLFSFKKRGTVN